MKENWGIVGIGRLGHAILTQFDQFQMPTGIYHPDKHKTDKILKTNPYTRKLLKEELASLNYLILALPTDKIIPFIMEYQSTGLTLVNTTLINMATTMPTKKLKDEFPDLTWLSMKFVGHSESLKRDGNGLFITEENVLKDEDDQAVYERFSKIGQLVVEDESIVEKVNKLATYHAIKAAKEIELKMSEEGFLDVYKDQAISSIMPEVIRAYSQDKLGHFAQEIVKKLES